MLTLYEHGVACCLIYLQIAPAYMMINKGSATCWSFLCCNIFHMLCQQIGNESDFINYMNCLLVQLLQCVDSLLVGQNESLGICHNSLSFHRL